MNKKPEFDIVIPAHEKDIATLKYCVKYAKKNIVGARKIIVISKKQYCKQSTWFSEDKFPFSYQEISDILSGSNVGWHFQQLLKLYCLFTIPDISENVLILDADTVFFKKTPMFDEENRPFYNISKDKDVENKKFDNQVNIHLARILPEITRENLSKNLQKLSGISHHMMLNRKILQEIFTKVENNYNKNDENKKFYQIFLESRPSSYGVAEYQTYFNYVNIFHNKKIRLRSLKYKNTSDFNILKYALRRKYDYCSFHSYMRNENLPKSNKNIFSKFLALFNSGVK